MTVTQSVHRDARSVSSPYRRDLVDPESNERYVGRGRGGLGWRMQVIQRPLDTRSLFSVCLPHAGMTGMPLLCFCTQNQVILL